MATAVVSEPPRPSVVVLPSSSTPWKPAMTGTMPWRAESLRRSASMPRMRAFMNAESVRSFTWLPVKLRAGTPALKVLTMLVRRTQAVMAELRSKYPTELERLAKQLKFGDREIVLMASLVEKETARPEERPRIAGVFYNRLRLPTFVPHLLQTDPTIVYGCTVPIEKSAACGKFEGRIRRIHLDDKDNAYSTYAHEGLPPGPISNPGRDALVAAIKPDPTPYLYFVSKNDGSHYFSKTVAEHEAAVDKYQRNK